MSKLTQFFIPIIAITTLLAAGCANSENYSEKKLPDNLTISSSSAGKYLTNSEGFSIYTFDKDQKSLSKCYGPCAAKWPPVTSTTAINKGKFSTQKRKDGSLQVSYDSKPLYLWVGDKKPGETTGDGIKNVWHIIKM